MEITKQKKKMKRVSIYIDEGKRKFYRLLFDNMRRNFIVEITTHRLFMHKDT